MKIRLGYVFHVYLLLSILSYRFFSLFAVIFRDNSKVGVVFSGLEYFYFTL